MPRGLGLWALLALVLFAVERPAAPASRGSAAPSRSGSVVAPAPPESVAARVLLIGDAGAPAPGREPVLEALTAQAAADAARTIVVFLGDDVYPSGLPDSSAVDWPEAVRRLEAQLAVLRVSGARGILLPGNHDWDAGADGVRRLGRYVTAHAGSVAQVLPGDACPGPAVVQPAMALRLILLDTEWWLHEGEKPRGSASGCAPSSEGAVLDSVRSALRGAGARPVIVLGHHPLVSGGPHGGHFGWQEHVFPLRDWKGWLWVPLPVIGSVYPEARRHGITNEDVSGPLYRRMREGLERALADRPPLVFGSGHDHGLQVIAGTSARYLVVSGAGTFGHLSYVGRLDSTRFALRASGFVRLDVLRDGRVRLGAMVVNEAGQAAEAFSMWLR